MAETKKIHLKNVRLSFPSIFRKSTYDGDEGKYEATFLIPKSDKRTKAMIDKAIEAKIKEAKVKVPSDKRCLRDGDDVEYDGYADCWSIKAASNKRPTVINRDRSPITEDDEIIYAGCYVNAIVDIWIQNNKFGKRANCNLYGIQFVKDGDSFESGSVDVTDEFDELEDDDFEEDFDDFE